MNALPHFMVADGVWRQLGFSPDTRAHMLIGSAAPDAHRSIDGVGFRRLHFCSRAFVGYRRRDFLTDYLRPVMRSGEAGERAFWIGWYTHIIADSVWRRMLRYELSELWRNCSADDPELAAIWRANYRKASDSVDLEIARISPNYVSDLRWLLRQTVPHYDVFPLTPVALSHWIGSVTSSALPPLRPDDNGQGVITYPFVVRAVQAAQEEALAALAPELRRMDAGDSEDAEGV